jgi:hypothetical protein
VTRRTTAAPGWTEQPARVPESLARPVFTPAARVRMREAGIGSGPLTASRADGVIRLRDVEQYIADAPSSTTRAHHAGAGTDAVEHTGSHGSVSRPTQLFASSVTTSVQLPRSTTPEWRLARAALAATRVLRQVEPSPRHVRFRLPSLGGDGRDLVLAAIDDLPEEAIVARLRAPQPAGTSSGDVEVGFELLDLTALAVDGVTLDPEQHPVIVLGAPVAQLTPTSTTSTTLAVVDTLRLTVTTGNATTLETSAAVLGAVKASISRKGAP